MPRFTAYASQAEIIATTSCKTKHLDADGWPWPTFLHKPRARICSMLYIYSRRKLLKYQGQR